jgi:hypothetical protein
MYNTVFPHEIQGYQNLNCKTLNQAQAEALEIVHLYEIVQINAQKLKGYNKVLSENKLVKFSYNVLLVLWVFLVKHLNKFRLY